MPNINHVHLLELISQDTVLKRVANTNNGEYAGPCPFCGGEDRFRVWPNQDRPRFWCRQCRVSGDAISYIRRRHNLGYLAACDVLNIIPPEHTPKILPKRPEILEKVASPAIALSDKNWQQSAQTFSSWASDQLWKHRVAQEFLTRRGFNLELLRNTGIGYNPKDTFTQWGTQKVYLSAGIVLTWCFRNEIWKINFRRLGERKPKYIQAQGGANGLYLADTIAPERILVMVEGEFDALSIRQAVQGRDDIAVVATGSADGAKLLRWLIRAAESKGILLAFDNDEAGDTAAQWWHSHFEQLQIPNVRLIPEQHDVNEMLQIGNDILEWIQSGINHLLA